jgi:hypothetical protein
VASFGVADVLLTGGAFDLGQAELDSITLPSITPDTAGLVGQGVGSNPIFATVVVAGQRLRRPLLYDLSSASRVKYAAQGHLDLEAVDRVAGGVVRSRSSARGTRSPGGGQCSFISARPACGTRPGSSLRRPPSQRDTPKITNPVCQRSLRASKPAPRQICRS